MADNINKITTHSTAETEREAERFAASLKGNETIAFFGGLGMGKTAFVRGLARGLGVDADSVSSPTFAIMHEHDNADGRLALCHYDMYRISGWEDLETTGFFDTLDRCVNAVEWSENIEEALPLPRWHITIERGVSDDERVITEEYISGEARSE